MKKWVLWLCIIAGVLFTGGCITLVVLGIMALLKSKK